MTVKNNDWPAEVQDLRRISEEEGAKLKHDVPPGLDVDNREFPRQVEHEKHYPPHFADLDEEDDPE